MRKPPRFPLSFLFYSLLTTTTRLRNRPARLLVLLGLIAVATTALASSTASAGSLQKLFASISRTVGVSFSEPQASAISPRVNVAPSAVSLAPTVPQGSSSSMAIERRGHTATSLPDGGVLIAGGENGSGVLNSTEIFDPTAGTFSLGGNLNSPRVDHSATKLADGRVLIAGGRDATGATNSTEIFDPTIGAFASGPAMSVVRAGHSATLFADGRVLIAGGDANGSGEIFDPAAGTFSTVAANMSAPRAFHGAALLNDGHVLIVGGTAPDGSPVQSGEILDVANASFSAVVNNTEDPHVRPLLRVLPDGKVQIIGGTDHADMEMYDPAVNSFGAHAHVYPLGDQHPELVEQILSAPTRAALFHNGQTDSLLDRTRETITELPGTNQALVAGGIDSNGNTLGSASVLNSSPASVTTDKLDYAPGTPAIVTGHSFQPNELVDLIFHEDPHTSTELAHEFTVQADADGNFTFAGYAPEAIDAGITYILAAKGLSSSRTAQTTLTDAQLSGVLQGQNNPPCVSPSPCPWQTTNLSGWAELQTVPLRLFFSPNQSGNSRTFTIDIDHANGRTQGLDGLVNWSKSANVTGITIASGLPTGVTFSSLTNGSGATTWSYTFTVSVSDNNEGFIQFNTQLLAGAHDFTGAALQVKGAGTVGFVKPLAAPGSPNLLLTKTALTAVSPGQTLTYTLSYRNQASGSGSTNSATGTQLTDVLPSEVTYVNGSCTPTCTYDSLSRTLSWSLGTIPAGSALATKTYQVTVGSALANNTSFTNNARIFSAETDANINDNVSSVTTTAFVPSISGSVLDDLNGDGVDNDGGVGLAGASVSLFVDTNTNGVYNPGTDAQVGSAITTPASGEWAFTSGLSQNKTYFAVRTNPAGYTSTQAIAGAGTNSTATKVSNDQIKVVLANNPNTFSSNNKFLAQQPNATISGVVLDDQNANGADDSDPGLSGATLRLYQDTNGNGTLEIDTDVQVGSDVISAVTTGVWSFTGLANGTYFVTESDPSGYSSTNAIAGSGTGTTATKITNNQIKVVISVAGSTSASNKFLDSSCVAPSITTQPASTSVCEGATATFTAAASGSPTPTVQWEVSTNGGSTWANVAGATNTTLSFTTTASQNGNQYRAVFTNSCGSATTTAATLTVNSNPTTANAATDQEVCALAAALSGNTPSVGAGTWTKVSGPGTVTFSNTNANSPGATATVSAYGTYVFRWTIHNGVCTDSSDDVQVIYDQNPTTANAGPDQQFCETSTATLAGNSPSVGAGSWTLVSGAGTITTLNSPTSGVTALGYGANTFRWTIHNGVCTDSTDDVIITRYQTPTTSNAGTDQELCETSTATLAGNTPSVGTGSWSLVSGSGTITTPSSPTSGVTSLGYGANTFRWTISNGSCTASTDDVIITRYQTPTTANAGPDQAFCETSTATLAGNAPSVGTGSWSLISGSGTISTPSSPTSGVTGLGYGANVFRWTISNGSCTSSTDDVTITRDQTPTTASAGPDQNFCETSTASLAGNTATVGTGTWTLVSGAGTITTSGSPTSGVTGLGYGANVFRWTIHNGTCTNSTDDVTINRYQTSTTANAGPDQAFCETSTATLAGNTPSVGTGTWNLVSGNGTITTPSSPTSGLTDLGYGANVFRWTIHNGTCGDSTDDVTITRRPSLCGEVGWWPGDGDANDIFGSYHGTLQNGATFATGQVGQAFSLDGVNDFVQVPDDPNLDIRGHITIDAWIKPVALGGRIVDKSGGSDGYLLGTDSGHLRLAIGSTSISSSAILSTTVWTHVAGVYDGSQLKVYINGVLDTSLAASGAIPTNTLPLHIGADQSGLSNFNGLIDEVQLYNRALSDAEVLSIFDAGSAGVCTSFTPPPSFTTQPQDATKCTSESVTFSVTAGTGLTYQWRKGGSDIAGGTNSSYMISAVAASDGGSYDVIVSDGCSSRTSNAATLTVNEPPTTASAGADQEVCALVATLSGNGPSVGSGTWTKQSGLGTVTFSNANSPTSTATVTVYGTYVLRWTIHSGVCADSTDDVQIIYDENPTTANAGLDQAFCETSTATLAGNSPTVGTGTWTKVSGTGTITTPSSPTSGVTGLGYGANVFRWTIHNGTCTDATDNVTITRDQTPTTANAGLDQAFCETSTATLAGNAPVVGTGTGAWSLVSGAGSITDASNPTSGVTALGYGANVFRWTISNGTCTASTDEVTINRYKTPTAANAGSDQVTACGVTTATLAGNAPAVGAGTGAWSLVSGSGTATTPGSPTSGVTGLGYGVNVFRWTISNGVCTPSYDDVSITVYASPVITSATPSSQLVQYSDPIANVSISASDADSGGTYLIATSQWKKDAGSFSAGLPTGLSLGTTTTGANSRTWTLSGNALVQAGVYTVRFRVTDNTACYIEQDIVVTVTQEDAQISYTGETIALINTNLNLRATVWDSTASGYSGANPETGGNATIGDITKIWIEFDIYPAGSCLSGTPTKVYAQVVDGLITGDGIGTASATYSTSQENSYCVVAKLVAGNAGGTNQWYTSPNAESAGLAFYKDTGQFVTGGGWVFDPDGGGNGKGNFGFNARFNNKGQPQGQFVYVFRGLYNGVMSDFVIKSNALSALGFSGTTYPITATLQGKNNIQINRASDGAQLYSDGNATFTAVAIDSGQSSGIGVDSFSLTVYDKNGILYKSVPTRLLQGGNIVVHNPK
jgi:uncharacterized repeat protein (TIGR01451 family)